MQNNPEAAPSTTAVAADLSSATKYPAEAGFSSAFTSPSLPSQTDEKPFSPPPSTVPADNPATFPVSDSLSTPASDALAKAASSDSSQEAPDKLVENKSAASKPSRKTTASVNIIPKEERVGVVLARKREEANVKIEDLAKRLNINEFIIRYLESGDYEGLGRAFGKSNCIYIIFNFKSIGEELGMSKNEIDDLVEKLNREIEMAGLKLDAPVKHDDDAKEFNSTARKRPVKSVLPKLIVFTLFIVCLLIFFLAIVVPYVSKKRPGTEKHLDFLPLVEQPWLSPRTIQPQQLPIP